MGKEEIGTKPKTTFWDRWLFGAGIYLVVLGIVLAFFSQTRWMDFLFNNQIDPVFWEGGMLPKAAERFQTWIYCVLGATVAGWGVYHCFYREFPVQET